MNRKQKLIIADNGSVSEFIPLCREFGLGIELQAFHDQRVLEQNPGALEEHRQLIQGILPLSLHGCFGDLCPGSFDPLVRSITRQRIEQSYLVAASLGAQHLVLHHGYVPHTSAYAGWLKRSVEFWQDYLQGKQPALCVHLENLLELDPGLIADVVRGIQRPNLDINLDIGHAHCNSRTPVVGWIEALGPLIGYVHLHDNRGDEDEHLGLGQGNIPLVEVCQALEQYAPDALWSLEVDAGDVRGSVGWLQEHGFLE